MDTVIVPKVSTCKPGDFYQSLTSWQTFRQSVRVQDDSGKVLAILLKNHIKDDKLLQGGRALYKYKGYTNLRPDASGFRRRVPIGKTQRGFTRGKNSPSSVVGYAGPSNFQPCRATALFRDNYDQFTENSLSTIECVSKAFKDYCPKHYKQQDEFVHSLNANMKLGQTVFTTLTVNCDFRTAAHRDRGDFNAGLGNLVVFQDPRYPEGYTGGELLMPEYQLAFDVREGDILFMDVHQLHCNNPIQGKGRISLVCYAMQKIARCSQNLTKKQLLDFQELRNSIPEGEGTDESSVSLRPQCPTLRSFLEKHMFASVFQSYLQLFNKPPSHIRRLLQSRSAKAQELVGHFLQIVQCVRDYDRVQRFLVVKADQGGTNEPGSSTVTGMTYETKRQRGIANSYKVQRIDPAHLEQPIAVYDSALEATRQIPDASKSRIIAAIAENTLYMGSRWVAVASDLDCNIIHNLPPLQHTRTITKGMVAKMDSNGSIKAVFLNAKEACIEAQLKLSSRGSMSNAINHGSLCGNHKYNLWDNCTNAQQESYIKLHGVPEPRENTGLRVSRLNHEKDLVEIYPSVEAVIKGLHIGRQTLYNAIHSSKLMKGSYWAFTDAKTE